MRLSSKITGADLTANAVLLAITETAAHTAPTANTDLIAKNRSNCKISLGMVVNHKLPMQLATNMPKEIS